MLYQKSPIPTHPHSPTHPLPLFGPGVPLYWSILILRVQWASLSSDGQLGHLLIHMQLESRAPGYWLAHNVVPPIGLQFNRDIFILNIETKMKWALSIVCDVSLEISWKERLPESIIWTVKSDVRVIAESQISECTTQPGSYNHFLLLLFWSLRLSVLKLLL